MEERSDAEVMRQRECTMMAIEQLAEHIESCGLKTAWYVGVPLCFANKV